MKIAVKEHAAFTPDKMAKIALATTERAQLDLYCVGPGQSQKPHRHDDQDKIYYVLEGHGSFTLAGQQEHLSTGEALVAPAGVDHGLLNDGTDPLLVLVIVTPPPLHSPPAKHPPTPHAASGGHSG